MKKYLIVLMVLILSAMGCSQIFVPGRVTWDTNYQDILHNPIPENVMVHYVWYSSNPDNNFTMLGVTQPGDSTYNLVDNHPSLYTGSDSLYFYLVSYRMDFNLFSIAPSDTTRGYWFPDARLPLPAGEVVIYDIPIGN